MAVCESGQLESSLGRMKREGADENGPERALPPGLPLTVDYRSPVSHFVPPAVELYAARQKQEQVSSAESSETTPIKRGRGRPRVDKTSPEYLANLAARKQAKEMAAVMGTRHPAEQAGVKRRRGRPRVDKTSPEYLARKRARELEALERKAKRDYKRRSTADSGASSSTGDGTPRAKRKYTKRTPSAKRSDGTPTTERVKGKRGRPRKIDQSLAANNRTLDQGSKYFFFFIEWMVTLTNPGVRVIEPPKASDMAHVTTTTKIRVRSNLMPMNSEPISLDSDDEPDLGSPSAASDSLSLDENLRALRHIHEKYANIDKDDMFGAHLLAANFKKPPLDGAQRHHDDDVMSIRSSEGGASVHDTETRVEKLEDSSNSDSDSSSSGSGSSSSGSSSSSSSCSSDSSDSSDSDSDNETPKNNEDTNNHVNNKTTPLYEPPPNNSESESDPEQNASLEVGPTSHDELSESDNESPDKSFQCHICGKWYSTRVTLKIHRRSHQNRGSGNSRSRNRSSTRYECDMCSETFPRREKLYAHKADAHRGAMTVRCEVCRRCFENEDELQIHRANHTDDEKEGRCGECGLVFPRYEQLRRHRAGHGDARGAAHACSHCGKRFTQVYSLARHLQNHAKQFYRCVVCKASFARADQLAQHLNSHLANYKRMKS